MIYKNLKHKYWYDEVYKMGFVFLLNVKDDKQIEDILKKKYPISYKYYTECRKNSDVSIKSSGGKNIQTENRQIIICKKAPEWCKLPYFMDVLTHECLHATMSTFEFRGVKYDLNSHNEHFTYYLGCLVRIALEK